MAKQNYAPIVFGKPTSKLLQHGIRDKEDLPMVLSPRQGIVLFEDFVDLYGAGRDQGQLGWADVNSGTGATIGTINNEDGRIGIYSLKATGSGGAALSRMYLGLNIMTLPTSTVIYEATVKFPVLSDGTNPYRVDIGLSDTQTAGDAANGVNFIYDQASNGDVWQTQCSGSSTITNDVLATAVVADTWYNLRVVCDGDASAKFYVDEVLVSTIATNLPTTGEDFGLVHKIAKTTGTTQRTFSIDYVYYSQVFDTLR